MFSLNESSLDNQKTTHWLFQDKWWCPDPDVGNHCSKQINIALMFCKLKKKIMSKNNLGVDC